MRICCFLSNCYNFLKKKKEMYVCNITSKINDTPKGVRKTAVKCTTI